MVKVEEVKKSHFLVLSEEKEHSVLERQLLAAFRKFKNIHIDDSEVAFMTTDDERFGETRRLFGISQTPAFVITDEPQRLEKGLPPFISFNRPAIEQFSDEKIFSLITDVHYLLLDEDILYMTKRESGAWLLGLFGSLWDEIEDFVHISVQEGEDE